MRYTPAVIVLAVSSGILVLAVWLLAVEFTDGRTGSGLLIAVVLLLVSFFAAAWATGRIRRIRALTPEAFIHPPDTPES